MPSLVKVKLTKQTLYFTEEELFSLFCRDLDLWETALRRGKAIERSRKGRQAKLPLRVISGR